MVVIWLPNIDTEDAPSSRRNVGFSLINLLVLVLLEAVMVAI